MRTDVAPAKNFTFRSRKPPRKTGICGLSHPTELQPIDVQLAGLLREQELNMPMWGLHNQQTGLRPYTVYIGSILIPVTLDNDAYVAGLVQK